MEVEVMNYVLLGPTIQQILSMIILLSYSIIGFYILLLITKLLKVLIEYFRHKDKEIE